jgi:hypothetical protein
MIFTSLGNWFILFLTYRWRTDPTFFYKSISILGLSLALYGLGSQSLFKFYTTPRPLQVGQILKIVVLPALLIGPYLIYLNDFIISYCAHPLHFQSVDMNKELSLEQVYDKMPSPCKTLSHRGWISLNRVYTDLETTNLRFKRFTISREVETKLSDQMSQQMDSMMNSLNTKVERADTTRRFPDPSSSQNALYTIILQTEYTIEYNLLKGYYMRQGTYQHIRKYDSMSQTMSTVLHSDASSRGMINYSQVLNVILRNSSTWLQEIAAGYDQDFRARHERIKADLDFAKLWTEL